MQEKSRPPSEPQQAEFVLAYLITRLSSMANRLRQTVTPHPGEQHQLGGEQSKLNWLRAGVLGANDGIVSVAGTIIGVAGAGSDVRALLVAGFAALAAGAFSMAGGEYVSVSTQRDTERAMLDKERWELENCWDDEVDELAQIYETKGISPTTARTAALEAMHTDALYAHATDELGLDPNELINPWSAAFSSFVSFTAGGLIPLLFALLPIPTVGKIVGIVFAAAIALCLTGFISAKLGGADWRKAVIRNAGMGLGTMLFAWLVGLAFNVSTGA